MDRLALYAAIAAFSFIGFAYAPPAHASQCATDCENTFNDCVALTGDWDHCYLKLQQCYNTCESTPTCTSPNPPPSCVPTPPNVTLMCTADGGFGQRFCEVTPYDASSYFWYATGSASVNQSGQSATSATCYGSDGRIWVDVVISGDTYTRSKKCY